MVGTTRTTPHGLADAVGRAAANDWRAATWMLEHHPLTREDFGDLGRDERVRRELLACVVAAIAAAALAPPRDDCPAAGQARHGVSRGPAAGCPGFGGWCGFA